MSLRTVLFLTVFFSACSGIHMIAKGNFSCNAANPDPTSLPVRVELKEEDGVITVAGAEDSGVFLGIKDQDDTLGEVTVTYQEKFAVEGYEFEFGYVEPYLLIHHRCGLKPEDPSKVKTVKMERVKSPFISKKSIVIEMGVINLNE